MEVNNECYICFDSLYAKDVACMGCGHVCCLECLKGWLERTDEAGFPFDPLCPVCRYNPDGVEEINDFHPLYFRAREASAQGSSPVRPGPSSSQVHSRRGLERLIRTADAAQRQMNALKLGTGPPDAGTLSGTTDNLQNTQDVFHQNPHSVEAQNIIRHLTHEIKALRTHLDARHNTAVVELNSERTLRRTLQDKMRETSDLHRAGQKTIHDQALEVAFLKKKLAASREKVAEVQRKAGEESAREVQALNERHQKEMDGLKGKNLDQTQRISALLASDNVLKDSISRAKQKLNVAKEQGQLVADLQDELSARDDEISKLRTSNSQLTSQLACIALPSLYQTPFDPLTKHNLAAHTSGHIVIEDSDDDIDADPMMEHAPGVRWTRPQQIFKMDVDENPFPERPLEPQQKNKENATRTVLEAIDDNPFLDRPRPGKRAAAGEASFAIDKSMLGPDLSFSRQRPPAAPSGDNPLLPLKLGKRKAENDPLAFLTKSKSLAMGPKRSRRIP